MRWLKRDIWKVGIAVAGLLLLLVFMLWRPVSAGAFEGALGTAIPITVQATPTVDPTMTALQKEQLTQQVRQLDDWWLYWLYNGSAALIAAITAIVVASIGLYQWRGNQNAERKKEVTAQDKELRDRAEERFKTAITALGDKNEATQVGGAILLRSFLNKEDEAIYERYYMQIFDLAVAYLRFLSTHQAAEDPDGVPTSSKDPNNPLPLTPLRQTLIIVFKESFPLVRKRLGPSTEFLDASCILLDNAHLADADLQQGWFPEASMWSAALRRADFSEANLYKVNLSHADLKAAILTKTNLYKANLTHADLSSAHLTHANLRGADLSSADLSMADLTGADLWAALLGSADLREANLKETIICFAWLGGTSLNGADLRGADLRGADLREAHLRGADLREADLRGYYQGKDYPGGFIPILFEKADLSGADLTGAKFDQTSLSFLKGTNLCGVKGLSKEQLEACKAKGAIIDEETTTSSSQPDTAPPPPSQSSEAPSSPTQVNTPHPSSDRSNTTSSQ